MSDLPSVAFVAGTLGPGGAERQLYEQCRILVEAGRPPLVLSLTRGEQWEGPLRDLGVDVVWVGRSRLRLLRLAAVVRALRGRHVDVIQASHAMTNLYAVGAGWVTRRPGIGALRTTPDQVVRHQGALGRAALRAPTRLAGNSRANLDAAVALGARPERVHYLPNAIDLERFAPPEGDRRDESVDVVYVGRLGSEKRVDVLIEALARIHERGREVSAAIVGTGPLDTALRDQAARSGLGAAVVFVGQSSEPEHWYRRARLLVMASEREGTPNAVLEAMACGLPVIATPVGSVPDLVIDGRTGHLVDVGDVDGLARAIVAVLDDPAAAASQGVAARQLVEEGFAEARLEASLRDLYREVPWRRRPCVA